MEPDVRSSRLIGFKGFELNCQTHELYRRGLKVKLHGQPIDVLAILVAHPGEMISRETLKKSLWPQDTFVDFEHSLNSAINRLREALGDSSDAPRFIETIPRLGYRFIAPVESQPSEPVASPPKPAGALVLQPVEATPEGTLAVRRLADFARTAAAGLWKHRRLSAACAAVTILAVMFGLWQIHRPLSPPHMVSQTQITFGGMEKEVVGTDGALLFLNLWDERAIAYMPISGGAIAQVHVDLPGAGTAETEPPGHAPWLLDVSPDGSHLLVLDHAEARVPEVWVLAASGDAAHYLGKARDAAWCPDGKNVIYATPRGEIYIMPADGGEAELLAEVKSAEMIYSPIQGLRFSPDGKTIRFSRGRELWEMDAAGSNLHRILERWHPSAWKCCGRWTADGEFYVFLSGPSALNGPRLLPGGQLWAIDERKGRWRHPSPEPSQLTSESTFWGAPIPAREGHTVFARGVTPQSELVHYDSQSQQFQPFLGGISAEFVDFSPDGSSVAYVSYPDGALWKARGDGTARAQLTAPPIYPKLIRWSPDGTQILFTDFSPAGLETVYVISSQGGTPMRVLPEDSGPQQDANWSPDGSKVVFSSRSDFSVGRALEQGLRILDLASHKVTSIPDSDSMVAPRWSPDGRYIAALTMTGSDLVLFDLAAQQWTTLAEGQYPQSPAWSRDSRFIYFVLYQDHGVFRISPGDNHVERVASLKDFRHAGWYNLWLGLDSGDAPLLLRELGSEEIYRLSIE
ncbi:MAG: winged helix-turn-helix domain-containing protein [Terracidiphilus sp.]|jgi:Tol biopolymer transport system component/DNA-binding winged helix-turn-helix (wHTH) protein